MKNVSFLKAVICIGTAFYFGLNIYKQSLAGGCGELLGIIYYNNSGGIFVKLTGTQQKLEKLLLLCVIGEVIKHPSEQTLVQLASFKRLLRVYCCGPLI